MELATLEAGAHPTTARLPIAVKVVAALPHRGSLSDEMSTSSMTTGSCFLLASASFTAADLTTSEEEGPNTEEECMPYFFTAMMRWARPSS